MLFISSETLKIIQTLALGELIQHFSLDESERSTIEAYVYATIIAIAVVINLLISHNYFLGLQHIGMKLRISCCSLIYRKSLNLSQKALSETTAGHIINLMSNDVNRFDDFIVHVDAIWLSPFFLGAIFYIIYNYVGPTGCFGLLVFLLYVPIQILIAKRISIYRFKAAKRTDERARLMNEIINGIKVIKMLTWEKAFTKLVTTVRKLEMKQIKGASQLRGVIIAFLHFNTRLAIFTSIAALVLLGKNPNAYYVFMISAFFNSLRVIMTAHLPEGLMQLAELNVSVERIQAFLLLEEKRDEEDAASPSDPNNLSISLESCYAKWDQNSHTETLHNINLLVGKDETIAIIGEVGSGKSTLLQIILKELPVSAGKISVHGTISYAPQEPWIFPSTIRQNILLGSALDETKYARVVKVCALQRDFSILPQGDRTRIGERGARLSGGQRARISLARAVYRDADIYLLDDPLSAVDTYVGKQIFQDCIMDFLKSKTVVLITHQVQYLGSVDKVVVLERGGIVEQGRPGEMKLSWKKFRRGEEEEMRAEEEENGVEEQGESEVGEQRSHGKISEKVYGDYVTAGGGFCAAFAIIFLFAFSQILASGADYFVTYWVNLEEETDLESFFSRETSAYFYLAIIVALIASAFLTSYFFFKFCIKASTGLHDKMLSKIIYATMRFFNNNPSGRILNRFSKDIGTVDEVLPLSAADTFQIGMSIFGIIFMTALVNYWLIVAVFGLMILALFLRRVYLATSRNIKRLEGITKSPVFTHVNASLQGIVAMRAFSVQDMLKLEFDGHQDIHSSAYFTFLACTRTFGFWIDAISATYIVIVAYSFLLFANDSYAGNIGLAVTQALSLTGMVQWGLRQWSELENQMTSVERIVEYTQVVPEAIENGNKPPVTWPEFGRIEFQHVSLRYSNAAPYVLKDLNFVIDAKSKIGIVGRTGAGKSSLITAMFLLTETEGEIRIDGVVTETIGLHCLRSKISIIPQEPILFAGTLRDNLDPFGEFKDEDLWSALGEIGMKATISELPGALSYHITEGGSNFSVGQRQLLCLARAIIRNNKILILDEATASVDNKTDQLIQATIRRKFSECTVLTIAHRLHTVMDSDRVLVMDEGRAVEYDHPYVLLGRKGVLFGMVESTGAEVARTLTEMSRASYFEKESQVSTAKR